MRFRIVVCVVMLITLSVVAETYQQFCVKSVAALNSPKTDESFVAYLDALISGSKGEMLSSASIVRSIFAYNEFERTLNPKCISMCVSSCETVLLQEDMSYRSWQKSAAAIIKASTKALDAQYKSSYEICKLAIEKHAQEPKSQEDCKLWEAIATRYLISGLSVMDALNFYAAMSLLMQDPGADCARYTKTLPANALEIIDMIRSRPLKNDDKR